MSEKFGDRLHNLRKEQDLTIDEFANEMSKRFPETKLSKPMVSRYENNVHQPQRFSVVQEIAEFFGVTTDYLMGKTADRYEKFDGLIPIKKIPRLSIIVAGVPILAQENIEGYEIIQESWKVDFSLRVNDDSMINARIIKGDLVFIHQQPDVENGEIAAVLVDGGNATLKRVYKGTDTVILHSENPKYPDQVFSRRDMRQVSIIGKAVRFNSEVR